MPQRSPLPDTNIIQASVHDYILQGCAKYTDDVALVESRTNRSVTFQQVLDLSESISWGLQAAGLAKGDIALLAVPNCPEYALFMMGVLRAGGVVSGVNVLYTKYEIAERLSDCQPSVLLTTTAYWQTTIEPALAMYSGKLKAIYLIDQSVPTRLCTDFKDLLTFSNVNPKFTFVKPRIEPRSDLAFLPYSSGTTGKPKGVMLTHYNIMVSYQSMVESGFFLMPTHRDAILIFMPLFHAFGQSLLYLGLHRGCKVVLMETFSYEEFLENIQKHKVVQLMLVPPLVTFLAKDPMVDKYDLSHVKAVNCGSAPCGPQLTAEFLNRFPNVQLFLQGYGLTECTVASHMTVPVPGMTPPGSVGILINNFEAMVVNPDSAEELGPNERGEIWLRSGAIMKGYLNRPEATAQTVDEEGWLHTGDIGFFDDEENFFIVDRLKELIKVKGFQVPPAELEDLISAHPLVADVGVVGVPDAKTGEKPICFVVRSESIGGGRQAELTEALLKDYVKGRVAPYKRLAQVVFTDRIPKLPSGKILRRELRERFHELQKSANLSAKL